MIKILSVSIVAFSFDQVIDEFIFRHVTNVWICNLLAAITAILIVAVALLIMLGNIQAVSGKLRVYISQIVPRPLNMALIVIGCLAIPHILFVVDAFEWKMSKNAWSIAFGLLMTAGIREEIFFRGLLYGGLRKHVGFLPASLISGCVFGAFHVLNLRFQDLDSVICSVLAGVIFSIASSGLLEMSRGSLIPCVLYHWAVDLTMIYDYGNDKERFGTVTATVVGMSIIAIMTFYFRKDYHSSFPR